MSQRRDVAAVFAAVQDTLETARLGLEDACGKDSRRQLAGLRNVAVFGRAVTNSLQTLRSTSIGPEVFDAWYGPRQQTMAGDEVLRFFYKLRSEILKEGTVGHLSTHVHIVSLTSEDMRRLMANPPPRARSFFIGDQLGRSGWEVETIDGEMEQYFVELPGDIGVVTRLLLADAPDSLGDRSLERLSRHYFAAMEQLVNDALEHFARPA